MMAATLSSLIEPMPSNFEQTIIQTHRREGALAVLDELFEWRPSSLANDDSLQEVLNDD